MAPTYTITNDDVASVDPASSLTAGVSFDYGAQVINVPSGTAIVDAQWIADHCAFVEDTVLGIARPPIHQANGKYQKGIDPGTGSPVLAGVESILLDGWLINTLKTSGAFKVVDVYRTDGSYPIVDNPDVKLQYETSIRTGLVVSSGSEGATPATFWSYNNRSLTDRTDFALSTAAVNTIAAQVAAAVQAQLADEFAAIPGTGAIATAVQSQLADEFAALQGKVDQIQISGGKVVATIGSDVVTLPANLEQRILELWRLWGLDAANPASLSPTQRSSGSIVINISQVGSTATLTRQP